jgi:hypothetical protein
MGVVVWPMIELEADDGLASAAHLAATDPRVLKVCIWTPDKDLGQCVREDRVVQIDRRSGGILNANDIKKKFGVSPELIPDFLALVATARTATRESPALERSGAASSLNQYGPIERFPKKLLGPQQKPALLFKRLATLRTDAPLFDDVEEP